MAFRDDYSTLMANPLPLENDADKSDGAAISHGRAPSMIREMSGAFHDTSEHAASLSDRCLVLAARSGCQMAFGKLWNLYSRRVYRTIVNIVKNPQDAEDALQDSFLRAFLALESFEGRSSFYSWLTRIAINSALAMLRKRRYRPETSLDSTSLQDAEPTSEYLRDLAPDPEHICYQQQRRAQLMLMIGKLPTNLREAVQRSIAEDCSVKEVAYRLNISQAAVKSRLYRARTRLSSLAAAHHGPKGRTAVCGRTETPPG
jgi:RNA polymerase sigma-70 factor (ECF subfamily)